MQGDSEKESQYEANKKRIFELEIIKWFYNY